MNTCVLVFTTFLGYVMAQGEPFGEFPDYGDHLVGPGSFGGNSGETNSIDVFGAAAAAAGAGGMGGGMGGGTGMMGANAGMGGGGMGGGMGGYGNQGYGNQGYGAGAGYGGYPGQGYGNTGMMHGGGSPFLDQNGAFDQMPFNSNPHLVRDGRAQAVSASTVAGATIAVIVVVVIFAGIAIFIVRQRRNSRVMIASV